VNLYISADMEGTAAVASWTQVDPKNAAEYPEYRRYMSLEVRAAIDGAREAGVKGVLINDSHSAMRNVMWEELPDDVRIIYGNRKPFSMTEGIGSQFSAAFFTGYHAGIGTRDGTLDHTYSPETIYNVRINGTRCNEALLNAAMLGVHGVPVVLISGDRAVVEETVTALPWVTGVIVKESIGRYSVNSLSPGLAQQRIREGARNAIEHIARAKPFIFEPPLALEIDFAGTQNADFAELIPGFDRIGGRTTRFVHDDYRVVFRAFMAAMRLGGSANTPV
jgi:D-amino peptidase